MLRIAPLCLLAVVFIGNQSTADIVDDYSWSAHAKYQTQFNHYPENSFYRQLIEDTAFDQLIDTRWKLSAKKNSVDFQIDYQLQAVDGDRVDFNQNSASLFSSNSGSNTHSVFSSLSYPTDKNRALNLMHVISSDEDTVVLHRLDRLSVGYTNNKVAVRVGRQVVSWGNGLIYNPLDFFNPFDPTSIDKEYKTGDDMLYGQYLFDSGSDLQAVWVVRRQPELSAGERRGDIDSSQQSLAIKYQTIIDDTDVSLVLSQHYEDAIMGVGAVRSIGGALWRSDLMLSHTDIQKTISFVTNLSYSWVWRKTNFNGVIEYFYNGFGVKKNKISVSDITPNHLKDTTIDLLNRLQRGELYGIGKHYLAASATVELSPLVIVTPVILFNVVDHSALLQLTGHYDIAQNWQLVGSINFPLGPKDTEFGGMSTDIGLLSSELANTTLATDASLFLQLAFYF
ncbi:MAG: hypothetical protein ACRBCS_07715 [Cellvibrionaceae bacterium]